LPAYGCAGSVFAVDGNGWVSACFDGARADILDERLLLEKQRGFWLMSRCQDQLESGAVLNRDARSH